MTLKLDEKTRFSSRNRYVLAISGGLDSVVLLDLLKKQLDPKSLIVVHIDHGIREESDWDLRFAKQLAKDEQLKFRSTSMKLGPQASELQAREGRYRFLNQVKKEADAKAIVTAHHQGDVVETMILNIIRGTGRKGLISLKTHDDLLRPLLHATKQQLYDYAVKNKLEWLEDETNKSTQYLRNRIRLELIPRAQRRDPKFADKLLRLRQKIAKSDEAIDKLLESIKLTRVSRSGDDLIISRRRFIMLDGIIRRELLMHILRSSGVNLSKVGLEDVQRMEHFICTAKPAKLYTPTKHIRLKTTKTEVKLSLDVLG